MLWKGRGPTSGKPVDREDHCSLTLSGKQVALLVQSPGSWPVLAQLFRNSAVAPLRWGRTLMAAHIGPILPKDVINSLPRRRFNTIDAFILVAAIAVGLAGGKAYLAQRIMDNMPLPITESNLLVLGAAGVWVSDVVGSGNALLSALTLALLVLRLRRPRPRLRIAIRQPGTAACATALVVSLVKFSIALSFYATLHATSSLVLGEDFNLDDWGVASWADEFNANASIAGEAVATIWIILALGRTCRFDGGWIDRLGCFLGVWWILNLSCECLSQMVANYYFYSH